MCFSQNKLAPPPPMLIYKNKIKIIVNLAQFEIFHLLPFKKGNNSSFQLLVKRKQKIKIVALTNASNVYLLCSNTSGKCKI